MSRVTPVPQRLIHKTLRVVGLEAIAKMQEQAGLAVLPALALAATKEAAAADRMEPEETVAMVARDQTERLVAVAAVVGRVAQAAPVAMEFVS